MQGDWLAHHGIEGQKWGVRNGPPYPLDPKVYKKAQYAQKQKNKLAEKGIRADEFRERHVVPKGTTMYRTTTNPNEVPGGPMYVSYIDADRYNYKGGWIRKAQNADKAYENKYTLQEDLVVPSRKELSEVIYNEVKKNPNLMKRTMEAWVDMAVPTSMYYQGPEFKKFYDATFNSPDDFFAFLRDSDRRAAYEKERAKAFVKETINNAGNAPISSLYFQCAQTLGKNPELKNVVINELSKRGYNAITDEASVGGQNGWGREGIDPLIIFDGSVLQKNKTSKISSWSESNNSSKSAYWRSIAGGTGGEWSDESGIAL